jgi:hypothetical protein
MAWSADTGSAVRGSCGADIRAYVNTGNLTGAVWGAIIQAYNWGTVPGNTDGTLIGLEVQSANWRGTAPASPGVALQKLGVHIVAAGPAAEVWHSTCALWINGNNTTNAWHKGLYSTPSAYVDTTGATTDTFIELANTMWVKPTGAVWTTSGYAQGAAINPATRVHANALSTVGGTLSSTANNKVGMASFGAIAVGSNDINLGVYAARRSSGSDYTTAAVGFQYDVDASANVGGQLWLSQAGIGVGGYAAQNHIRQVNVFSQASIAPGAIAANSSVVFGVTTGVTGLTVGDPVAVGFSPALNNGLTAYATVTAANQINVTIHNATAGSITPATSTVKCIVIN